MTLAHLTDAQRTSLLRRICAELGLNYDGVDDETLMDAIRAEREKAEKYVDLCR